MARSIKKGPYIDHNLEKKVVTLNDSNKKSVVKTWSRRSMISPRILLVIHSPVHNGNKFIPCVCNRKHGLGTSWANLRRPVHSVVTQKKKK